MKQLIQPRHKPTFTTPLQARIVPLDTGSDDPGLCYGDWSDRYGWGGVLYSAAHGSWRPWAMIMGSYWHRFYSHADRGHVPD